MKRLDEIRAREQAATGEPWVVYLKTGEPPYLSTVKKVSV